MTRFSVADSPESGASMRGRADVEHLIKAQRDGAEQGTA